MVDIVRRIVVYKRQNSICERQLFFMILFCSIQIEALCHINWTLNDKRSKCSIKDIIKYKLTQNQLTNLSLKNYNSLIHIIITIEIFRKIFVYLHYMSSVELKFSVSIHIYHIYRA